MHNLWLRLKGVLARMGIIDSIKTVADLPNINVNDEDMARVTEWTNLYKGRPYWIKQTASDFDGHEYDMGPKMSLHMPKVAAKKMASLVFNQSATITAYPAGKEPQPGKTTPKDGENGPNEMLQEILRKNHFTVNFERWAEYCYATGGIVAREYVNDGEVKIRFATADAFIPISQDANGVTECVIATTKVVDGKYYTLLEWHKEDSANYIIQNRLYRSTTTDGTDLGTEVSLKEVYPGLKPESLYPKSVYTRPTFQYLKPNIANNFNLDSPLGVPIYANAMDTLRELDEAYDLLVHEIMTGKHLIIAPDSMVKRRVSAKPDAKPQWAVDWRKQVYQPVRGDQSGAGKDTIQDMTLPFRSDQIISTINSLLKIFATQIGFSAGTFSYDEASGVQTATAVISENSATYQSKNSHETLVERFIQDIAVSSLELAKNATSVQYSDTADVTVVVNFDDSIAKDRSENAQFYQTMNGNKPLMPHLESIKRANGLDDQTAEQWLEQISAEEPSQGDMSDALTETAGEDDGD